MLEGETVVDGTPLKQLSKLQQQYVTHTYIMRNMGVVFFLLE
jgi:hypothetical protein